MGLYYTYSTFSPASPNGIAGRERQDHSDG